MIEVLSILRPKVPELTTPDGIVWTAISAPVGNVVRAPPFTHAFQVAAVSPSNSLGQSTPTGTRFAWGFTIVTMIGSLSWPVNED
jgi:hypothetical protein